MRHQEKHLSSRDLYISWVIDKRWLIQEFPGLKPDWFKEMKLFLIRNLNISLNINLSRIFQQLEAMRLVGSFSNIVSHFSYK